MPSDASGADRGGAPAGDADRSAAHTGDAGGDAGPAVRKDRERRSGPGEEKPREAAPSVAILAAVAENGVIGRSGTLPWHLSSDLKRFKALTLGNTVIVGRRTHQSIGGALPGRRTIVVTSQPLADVETAPSLAAALARAETPVFLAGGAGIYDEGFAFADTLYITRVHARPAGDTHFPEPPAGAFRLVCAHPAPRGPRDDHGVTFETHVRTEAGGART